MKRSLKINGIGVDIVELSRLDIENERFVRHILSDEEYVIFQSFPTKKRKEKYLVVVLQLRKLI